MMKLYFSIVLFLISSLSFAQSQNDHFYSIGISALSYGEYPKLLNETRGTNTYRTAGFNGLIFKFNDNQISYRFSGSVYSNKDYSFKNICNTCETVKGDFEDFSIKLGFERNIIYGAVQPFFGLDLGFKKVSFSGESNDVNTNIPQYGVDVEKNGGVAYSFIGIKFNFLKAHLTLSAEAGIDMLYSHDKEIKTLNNTNNATVNNFTRWGFYNRPLGLLSLQYNFGSQ